MKKSHLTYLRRIIGKAIADTDRSAMTETLLSLSTPSTVIYQTMRDIVCDARFYSVTDNDAFWKTYGAYRISRFLDSLSSRDWETDESLTMRKEDFLNEWMAMHMLPLSADRRREIEADIRWNMHEEDGVGIPDPDDHDGTSLGIIHLGNGIKDSTNSTEEPAEGLPPNLKDYMKDSSGGNTPGLLSSGHQAEARFMAKIHPSIVSLAEKIGRRGGITEEKKGKFRNAPKSDISGISVGSDLSSLLPVEIALLATPESEKVFLDRFTRKRLQIFSSVSRTIDSGDERKGPILLCIDTSGSMTGKPEELAKTLALAIGIVAQKESRPVFIFNYSHSISFFILRNLKTQRVRLLSFLSKSYGGGNDENKLFDFIFDRMPKLARYRSHIRNFDGADMLVISDFNWIGLEPKQSESLMNARKKGLRIFSVGIDLPVHIPNSDNPDESDTGYMSGYRFLRACDSAYRLEEGSLKESRY